TPFSINVVTQELIQNRQAQTIGEVFTDGSPLNTSPIVCAWRFWISSCVTTLMENGVSSRGLSPRAPVLACLAPYAAALPAETCVAGRSTWAEVCCAQAGAPALMAASIHASLLVRCGANGVTRRRAARVRQRK